MQQHELTLSWTWLTTSPLHLGSGLSQPGRADGLVQRDAMGRPVIVGDAVLGALRFAAEQVVGWLDDAASTPDAIPSDMRTAEPQRAVLAALFGGNADRRVTPGRLVGSSAEMLVAATAIERETGTAAGQTLRVKEMVAPGAQFSASFTAHLDDDLAVAATTLIVAALGAVESLGGMAGTGAGRVIPEEIELKLGGNTTRVDSVVSPERIEALREALRIPLRCPEPARRPNRIDAEPLVWHRMDIKLVESTSIGIRPLVGNDAQALDWVPATTLRGALRAKWLRDGANPDDLEQRLGARTRWTPAYPTHGRAASVPAPRSYVAPKNFSERGSIDVVDSLAPQSDAHAAAADLRPFANSRRIWLAPNADGSLSEVRVPHEVRMHVARNYRSGSKRPGALYSREAISATPDAPVCLIAWVKAPRGLATSEAIEVALGKRTAAGNGAATVCIAEAEEGPWPAFAVTDGDNTAARGVDVYVQLLTPAIVLDEESGHPRRGLSAGAFARLAGIEGIDESGSECRVATELLPGWMRPWGHGRASAVTIAAGSAWRLRACTTAGAERLRDALRLLAVDGLGERRHEGFGWLVVDPPWLGKVAYSISRDPVATDETTPVTWPGSSLCAKRLAPLAAKAMSLEVAGEARRPLQDLASFARTNSHTDVLKRCTEMSSRARQRSDGSSKEKPGQWKHLNRESGAFELLAATTSDDELRFVIEALLIRAGRERGARA